ncbi:hypothetical protein [Rhizobium halophilum]|uniref:hypothetical protein n=1 Tax=Rhizobium halophilum TaxID=2846852 RepID=UPI001EFD3958|nr:hypothetical protein [Rhizobium halophilum]MCF6367986.1 hypothetical protein [Rhizobium halophilum]
MQGNKTHQQQRNIIEKRVDTSNAGEDFDAQADLERSEAARDAYRKGDDLSMRAAEISLNEDDPAIVRGVNQESEHHKGTGSR